MKIKNPKLIKKFEKFILGLKKTDKIAVLHHTDPDGVCSAVIMNKVVEKSRGKSVDLRINQKSDELFISDTTLKSLKKNKINKLIVTDLSLDQEFKGKNVKSIQIFADDILILDHHKLYKDLNSKRITHIKPQMVYMGVDPSFYCASKLCFDLSKKIVDIKDADWLAVVGIIGDNGVDYWKSFIQGVFKRYKLGFRDNIFRSELGKIAELIFFTEAYDIKKVGRCFDIANDSKNFHEVLTSELQTYRREIKREIDYWQSNVEKLAEDYAKEELIFDFIKPRYPIKAAISTIMSYKYPNRTVIIAEDMNRGYINLSARRRDHKIAVNDLLETALKGLKDANGGGHLVSAGGKLRREDFMAFKFNILKILENRHIFR